MTMTAAYLRSTTILITAVVLAGCGSDAKAPLPVGTTPAAAPTSQAPAVALTGRTINVDLITDEKGNYFKPSIFEVHRGDVIRFTLVSGVHNVHFLADSNPGKIGLPPVSEFLQLPGQTIDLTVTLAPGKYYFQCDPHALLGMIGWIEVEDE